MEFLMLDTVPEVAAYVLLAIQSDFSHRMVGEEFAFKAEAARIS
jgi:hypothetical protein